MDTLDVCTVTFVFLLVLPSLSARCIRLANRYTQQQFLDNSILRFVNENYFEWICTVIGRFEYFKSNKFSRGNRFIICEIVNRFNFVSICLPVLIDQLSLPKLLKAKHRKSKLRLIPSWSALCAN